jgi:hypothetical protein
MTDRHEPPVRESPTPQAARIWTPARRLMGNLIPFLLSLPFGAHGAWKLIQRGAPWGEGLVWLGTAVAVLWLGVNWFGLHRNEAMKRAMRRRLEASLTEKEIPSDPVFVGFARPSYRSAVDPHEDIGFLLLHPDRVEFFGDKDRITLPKSCMTEVRLRPNPHSWALLGGWVSLEGVVEGQPVRMLFEPREKPTLWGNRALRKQLATRLAAWMADAPSAAPRKG